MNKIYLNTIGTPCKAGGGGNSGGGGSNYTYFNYRPLSMNILHIWEQSQLVKIEYNGMDFIVTPITITPLLEENNEKSIIKALCIDLNLRISAPDFNGTLEEFVGEYKEEVLRNSITESEFYNLNA